MNGGILVAYASRFGSTQEVAEAIAQELRDLNKTASVRFVDEVTDVSPYEAAIIGSSIRMGRWLPEAVRFVEKHREALSKIPVAYFVVCVTMREDTEAHRRKVLGYIEPVCRIVKPAGIGLFAGAVHYNKLSWAMKLMAKVGQIPEGDFRDWDAIYEWADDIEVKNLNT